MIGGETLQKRITGIEKGESSGVSQQLRPKVGYRFKDKLSNEISGMTIVFRLLGRNLCNI